MTKTILPSSPIFPPAEWADRDGVVGIGGELVDEWLLDAYRHGIFPWPIDDLLVWRSPDPRGILEFENLHVSRRLARTIRSERFWVTFDQQFDRVIQYCATVKDRLRHRWLNDAMLAAYRRFHRSGWAHSVEVWQQTDSHLEGELVGGIYGVAIGRTFSAESMFHLVSDASKVGLVALVRHLQERGFTLLDIQQLTAHSQRMGGTEISREVFLKRLSQALDRDLPFVDPEASSHR